MNAIGVSVSFLLMVLTVSSVTKAGATEATFGDDVAFLQKHTKLVVLSDVQGKAKIAVTPAWQGRVMTSTAEGDAGQSLGWINAKHIASGKLVPHMNIFGGEERFWLGPEGGQFSIFHAKGGGFTWENWQVPPALDSLPFDLVSQSRDRAEFGAEFSLQNHAGTTFQLGVKRVVRLLDTKTSWRHLGLSPSSAVSVVGYESNNTLKNLGRQPWRKETGLLSIWIAGMHPASKGAVFIVPLKEVASEKIDEGITSDYFGRLENDRLKVMRDAVYFRVDAAYQSKIGISPSRSLGKYGSYNPERRTLTITQFSQPEGVTEYVKSLWRLQADPYSGDAINSYNDGPTKPGEEPFGPFYEMESSSPAAALAPGNTIEHTHRTVHLIGDRTELEKIARATLGLSLDVTFGADTE
ncbi:hypothetical protein JM946_17405 [Steroidobacter sp. S1-65]|uniref:Uncharacterized protein n=1 Tax=Steroidobacter gossypii TaxID=2805490 RepID=A0ABS1WZU4_9GAMM|nr:DUF6786 family protein [Steroidobacter gossypii]MBM0106509.1 hypothetical protein [Steroidobacter gossypii]